MDILRILKKIKNKIVNNKKGLSIEIFLNKLHHMFDWA